jgi:hypothetical protein
MQNGRYGKLKKDYMLFYSVEMAISPNIIRQNIPVSIVDIIADRLVE